MPSFVQRALQNFTCMRTVFECFQKLPKSYEIKKHVWDLRLGAFTFDRKITRFEEACRINMQGAAAVEKMGPALFAIRFQKKTMKTPSTRVLVVAPRRYRYG